MTEVNKIHQADLLYLPHDKIYQNKYKYTLNVIDVASRYKESRPLKTQMLGMTPAKAAKVHHVELKVKPYLKEKVAPEDEIYRYLYKPGELEDDNQRRATDMIWSWDTF